MPCELLSEAEPCCTYATFPGICLEWAHFQRCCSISWLSWLWKVHLFKEVTAFFFFFLQNHNGKRNPNDTNTQIVNLEIWNCTVPMPQLSFNFWGCSAKPLVYWGGGGHKKELEQKIFVFCMPLHAQISVSPVSISLCCCPPKGKKSKEIKSQLTLWIKLHITFTLQTGAFHWWTNQAYFDLQFSHVWP